MENTDPACPPVFVINLPKDEQRREIMRARLEKTGAPFSFIEAVNGKVPGFDPGTLYDGAKRRRYFGRDLMPGEIGCLLSHRKLFEKMVTEKIPYAIILEDDVIFEDDFLEAMKALPLSPVKWDVVRFLGSQKIYARGCRKIAPLIGQYWMARLPTSPGGAHGYMLTLHAAEVMLKHMQSSWVPIDTLQGRMWETGLETLVLHPAPLHIDLGVGSTIGDERMDKTVRLQGLERIFFPLNRLAYKLSDTFGKRYIYWSSWPRDRFAGRLKGRKI